MIKHGAEFNSAEHGRSLTFDFSERSTRRGRYAYQVRRSEFDHLLLRHCAAQGAQVHEGTRVTAVEFPPDGIAAATADDGGATRRIRARFLVDASGRDTFLAGKLGMKRRNPRHASAALFGHFTGAERLPGREEGNISIFWFPHGWFWFIPLKDGTTSVGAVCWPYYLKTRKGDPTEFFLETHRALARARRAAPRRAAHRRRRPRPATTPTTPTAWRATATSWSATRTASSTRCSRAACISR